MCPYLHLPIWDPRNALCRVLFHKLLPKDMLTGDHHVLRLARSHVGFEAAIPSTTTVELLLNGDDLVFGLVNLPLNPRLGEAIGEAL